MVSQNLTPKLRVVPSEHQHPANRLLESHRFNLERTAPKKHTDHEEEEEDDDDEYGQEGRLCFSKLCANQNNLFPVMN